MTFCRPLLVGLVLCLLLPLLASSAQQPARVPRVGFLVPASPSAWREVLDAFRQGLRDQGYAEGGNIAIEYRFAPGGEKELEHTAAELVRLRVDLIVTAGEGPVLAAKHATHTIPIVMAVVGDAVGSGFVASLAQPGGNITGLSVLSPELSEKRLALLKEAFPRASRVAVLWNAANPVKALDFRETQRTARTLGIALQSAEVRGAGDLRRAFAAIRQDHPDALIAFTEELTFTHRAEIVDFANRQRLPAMYEVREFADAGGLMSYGPDLRDAFRRAAGYVVKILQGARPADLPVEQPTRFEMVVNLRTAKALGLAIPQSILVRADQIIQ